MEHRLIRGGEKFLPFARSRIRALKALGLPYANQSFEIGGATIRVRIEPEHEYITITVDEPILMDSGVVDLGGIGKLATATYKSGVLYKSGDVLAYDSLYSTSAKKNKYGDPLYAKNLKTPSGNVTGCLVRSGSSSSSQVVSYAPADAKQAESFSALEEAVNNPDGTTTYSPVEKDERLLAKKVAALFCPASMFTGRCRLYIQAIYGAPAYTSRTGRASKNVPSYNIVYEPGNGAPPYLEITPYVSPDDVNDKGEKNYYGPVAITKNTGIFLDPVSFRHYLITVNATVIHVYPMKVGAAASRLIPLLDPSSSQMTDTDRKHLEAYILSNSIPDASTKMRFVVDGLSTASSCGYGWHWNWSGTAADAVENAMFPQYEQSPPETNPLYFGMESTHLRLQLERVPTYKKDGSEDKKHPTFSFRQIVVSPPTKWAIHQHLWCIAFPAWDGTLEKLTPQRTRMFPCDATFYVFYIGDELQECKVHVAYTEEVARRFMSENYTASTEPAYGAAHNAYTLGLSGGYIRDEFPESSHYEVNFTFGNITSPTTTFEKWYSLVQEEVSEKTLGEWDESGQWIEPVFTGTIRVGYPSGGDPAQGIVGLNVGYELENFDALMSDNDFAPLSYNVKEKSGTVSFSGEAEIVIPTNDAEAVIFDCRELSTESTTVTTKWFDINVYSTWYATSFRADPIDRATLVLTGNIYRSVRYGWDDAHAYFGQEGTSLEITNETKQETVIERNATMLCNSGAVPMTMFPGSLSAFHTHSDPDVIPSPYFCLAGINSPGAPVVTKQKRYADRISDLSFAAVVGWA